MQRETGRVVGEGEMKRGIEKERERERERERGREKKRE